MMRLTAHACRHTAHNTVLNPSYNYDNRAQARIRLVDATRAPLIRAARRSLQAAVSYLHIATRALIKLFVSKVGRRGAAFVCFCLFSRR